MISPLSLACPCSPGLHWEEVGVRRGEIVTTHVVILAIKPGSLSPHASHVWDLHCECPVIHLTGWPWQSDVLSLGLIPEVASGFLSESYLRPHLSWTYLLLLSTCLLVTPVCVYVCLCVCVLQPCTHMYTYGNTFPCPKLTVLFLGFPILLWLTSLACHHLLTSLPSPCPVNWVLPSPTAVSSLPNVPSWQKC